MATAAAFALVGALGLAGCGGAEEKKAKTPAGMEGLDPAKARKLIDQGLRHARKKEFASAREAFAKAEKLADVAARRQLEEALDTTDKKQAKFFASDINSSANDGRCEEAVRDTNMVVAQGEGLAKYIRGYSGDQVVDCIVTLAEEEDLAKARELVGGDDVKKALHPHHYKKVKKAVYKVVAKTIEKAVNKHIRKRRWKKAMRALDKLLDEKIAGKREEKKVVEVIRAGIAEDIASIHEKAMATSGKGQRAMERIDALIAIGWPKKKKKKRKLPKDIRQQRAELALRISCDAVKCETVEPGARWVYGDAAAFDVHTPEGDARDQTVRHGTKLWAIAKGKKLVLVANKDPGTLENMGARAGVAWAWLQASDLRTDDTTHWLPPGEALVGTRVWGPLRKGDKVYELGTVTKVDGRMTTVKRMSDHKLVKMPRRVLHFGLTDVGTKVLAYCKDGEAKVLPGKITLVKESAHPQLGDSLVTVTCVDKDDEPDGNAKEGQMGSLRMNPRWLPKRR